MDQPPQDLEKIASPELESSTSELKAYKKELKEYKKELIKLFHKSQDTFEAQLSYISAGSLALSMGFIKDIITNFQNAQYRGFLTSGWVLLGFTLLINLISHYVAANVLSRTIDDINKNNFDETESSNRSGWVNTINWFSIGTLILGIFSIIVFVIINI